MDANLPKNFPGNAAGGGAAAGTSLPKNFPAGATTPAPAPAAETGHRPPEVSRREIAEFFAHRIVALRDQIKAGSTRPWLYAVEFPFNDFRRDVGDAFAQITGATWPQGSFGPGAAEPATPLVSMAVDIDLFVHYMNHGNDVAVFCPRVWMLPQALRDMLDTTITVQRFDATGFAAACADFFELTASPDLGSDQDWVSSVAPRDFLLSSQATSADIVPAVRRAMERRLARFAADEALAIDDFSGMEEARQWAGSLVEEIRLARAGKLDWGEIESGVALAGPHGVGKSSLAKAIARAAGVRYYETSAVSWMGTEKQPELGAERLINDFQEALQAAPAVFFIANLDCFNAMPWMALTGVLLEHLRSLKGEPGLVIIAGAQSTTSLPGELRQHGGIESAVAVPQPNSQALARMYELLLRNRRHSLKAADFDTVGRLSLGLSGDGVDLIVRRAARRARKDGNRPLSKDDLATVLIQELFGAHAESRRRFMREDELRNTAYHEAGHAILHLMRSRSAGIGYATIVPRENGTLGFVLPEIDETRNSQTRQDIIESIRVALAGRAAEEVLGGKDEVTSGCSSDLVRATWYVHYMLTRAGFHGLLSLDRPLEASPELRDQAEEILNTEYDHVLAVLQRHRPLLDRVAGLLIARQEVSGDELTSLYNEYRAGNPGA